MESTLSNLRLSHGSTCQILQKQTYMMMSLRYVSSCKVLLCKGSCIVKDIVKEVGDISVVTGIYWFTQDDFSRHSNG